MRNSEIKVLIVDDHAIVRMGLSTLLSTEAGIKVVGESDDGASGVRDALRLRPDVVIMDILMPGTDGIQATLEIKKKMPHVKVLILTTSTASDDISRAMSSGADGAIAKSTANAKLLAAIWAIAGGKPYVDDAISALLTSDPPAKKLTKRQSEILLSITRGLTNADIAKQFDISQESVKTHVDAIFEKLGAANRAEAVAIALRKHLLKI